MKSPTYGDGNTADDCVDLAREMPFSLADLAVTPAALVVSAGGWCRQLEPRAMQVLVVLARAAPAVVGRAELNRRVWGGRVVGEDAINRAVQTLRRVAAESPVPAPFSIATIPRVGYRLTIEDENGKQHAAGNSFGAADLQSAVRPASPVARTGRADRRVRWAAAVLAILVAVAVPLLWRFLIAHPLPARWMVVGAAGLNDLPVDARDLTLSPDGRRLAYRARDGRGRERIFVRAPVNGAEDHPVSPPGIDAHRPAWSPDGGTLAFSSYDPGRPCRLHLARPRLPVSFVGSCETARDPPLSWSADGRALLFGDAPGWNAVPRISRLDLGDGRRAVLSSPPGESMGDDLPMPVGDEIVFRRQFGWADEGWIARDVATGRERLVWRRGGVADTVAAGLPDGSVVIAWTRAGASGLDFIGRDQRLISQSGTLEPISSISAAGPRLLVEIDEGESGLVRAGSGAKPSTPLVAVRGRIAGPTLVADGRVRFPVTAAGFARIWEREPDGTLRPWGALTGTRIAGLAPSPDGRFTAALVTGNSGREIVVLDAAGRPIYRWNPHSRSLNPAAWSGDGRHLIAPVLDGAGWRLFSLDPIGRTPPRDLHMPGFAVLLSHGSALYAVRAGETVGMRELWRIDGRARRLPIDLTLFDIVNWYPVAQGIWLPVRGERDRPRLVLRDADTGRILRSVAAPELAGSGSGLAADAHGPVYVTTTRGSFRPSLLTLAGPQLSAAQR